MTQPIRISLGFMPSEILSDICSHLGLMELSRLYAINNRILQLKLSSPGCVPKVLVMASNRNLLLETRNFLRNHSGLEVLRVSSKDVLSGQDLQNPGVELSDDVIQIVNPRSLRSLVLAQPVPLITGDKNSFEVFPLLERFPQLEHLEIQHNVRSGLDSTSMASFWLGEVLNRLEGLEHLTLKVFLDLATVKLPSTLTSLDFLLMDSDANKMLETLESIKNQCPNLKNVSLFLAGVMSIVPLNVNNTSTVDNSSREWPAFVLPFEDFTCTLCNSDRFVNPMRGIRMPHLKSLTFNLPVVLQSSLLLDLLKSDCLTSLSIGEPSDNTLMFRASVNMTLELAEALPASLTSLRLGNLVNFDLSSQTAFNFFIHLPRCLQHLAIRHELPSYDWKCLPVALETMKLRTGPISFVAPILPLRPLEPITLSCALPCTRLKSFDTGLHLSKGSISHLPSSLTCLSCMLWDTWEIDHVRQLAAQLPLARISLDGNVRLTEGPAEGTLDVNLDEFAFKCLGPEAKHRCSGYKWVVEVASQNNIESFNAAKNVVLPSSTTTFTAHLSQGVVIPQFGTRSMANRDFAPNPSSFGVRTGSNVAMTTPTGSGVASVPNLMQALSTLPNLTSLTLSSGSSFFPLEGALKNLNTLLHLNLCTSRLQNFSPDWLPTNLRSFTSLAYIPIATRKNLLFMTRVTNDHELPSGFLGVQEMPTILPALGFGGFYPEVRPFTTVSGLSDGLMSPLSNISMNSIGVPAPESLSVAFSPYTQQTLTGFPSISKPSVVPQSTRSNQTNCHVTAKDRIAEFPPNLTLLVIPEIPLLDDERSSLPITLKTLSINTRNWKDNWIHETKSRLPNLTSYTVSDVMICEASIPPLAQHLDWEVLREGAKSLTTPNATPTLQVGQLQLPKSLQSLSLCALDEMRTAHEDSDVPFPSAFPITDHLTSSFTKFSQLGRLPKTLTKMHIQLQSSYLELSGVTLPETLLDLSLGSLAPNSGDPLGGIPTSVTRLSLGFVSQAVCRFSQTIKIPQKLVYLRAMELLIFPAAIELLPKSLTDIGISGCGGWRDVHIKQLQEHIQPKAKIWLSRAEVSGTFLPSHLESLSRETMYRHTSMALGAEVTCSWSLSSALILPPMLTTLSCSISKSLLPNSNAFSDSAFLRGEPNYYPLQTTEQDFDLASLLPLRHLNSLSLALRNFTLDQANCLPASLTSLSLKIAVPMDVPALWSALPRNLLHFQLDRVRPESLGPKIGTELDGIPQNLLSLYIPILSPSECAIRNLPPSLTHLRVDESPLPLDVVKSLHPCLSSLDASSVVQATTTPVNQPKFMMMYPRID